MCRLCRYGKHPLARDWPELERQLLPVTNVEVLRNLEGQPRIPRSPTDAVDAIRVGGALDGDASLVDRRCHHIEMTAHAKEAIGSN